MENTAPQQFDLLAGIAKTFQAIGKGIVTFFIWIYKFCLWFINIHFRYFFIFLVVYGFVFAWAYLHRKDNFPTCTGDAIIYCNGFDNYMLDQEIQSFNSLSTKHMYKSMAEMLGLEDSICRLFFHMNLGIPIDYDEDGHINEYLFRYSNRFAPNTIEGLHILKTREEGEVIHMRYREQRIPDMGKLRIIMYTDSIELYNKFTSAVINYLNTAPSLLAQHDAYLNKLTSERNACDRQLHILDSMQTTLYFDKKNSLNGRTDYNYLSVVAANENLTGKEIKKLTQPVPLFYEDVLALTEKRNELDSRIQLSSKPITVLSDFHPAYTRGSHSWFRPSIIKCIILGLILGTLIDFRQEIWTYIRRQRKIGRNKEEKE